MSEDIFDVVVVGSGGAGMGTAYFSAVAGNTTLVVERADVLGGTTAYSGGGLWLPASAPHERAGLDDSTEKARAYLNELLGDYEIERREAFLTTAPTVMAELEKNDSLKFQHQAFPDYFDKPGRLEQGRAIHPLDMKVEELGELADMIRPSIDDDIYKTGKKRRTMNGGRALIARLLKAAHDTGNLTVATDSRITELVTDDEGRVTGVRAETADGERVFTAKKGVVLAAGGFERSASMREVHGTPGSAEWTLGPDGTNEGEPIQAAQKVGAAIDLMDQAWFCPGIVNYDGSATFSLGFRSGFFIDQQGQRFANETLPYDQMGRVLAEQPDQRVPSWFVFDSREGGGLPAISLPTPDPARCLESGEWVQANSLDDLADKMGVASEALQTTTDRYNELAEAGEDTDFGRGNDVYGRFFLFDPSAGKNAALPTLDRPPYYAAKIVLGDLGTKGGVVTNVDAQALCEDGSVIEGLYAVGNTAAAWSRDVYPGPGTPIGTGIVFGYRAVKSME